MTIVTAQTSDPADHWEEIKGSMEAFIGTSPSHPIMVSFGRGDGGYAFTAEEAKNIVSRLNSLLSQIE